MRLSKSQIESIKNSVKFFFGKRAVLYLFGSRTDDSLSGGDIDLLVLAPQNTDKLELKKLKAISKIQLEIGDQKIDMIVSELDMKNPSLIVREALKGVIL